MNHANSLKSRVLKSENIEWRSLQFLQSDSLKNFDDEARKRLTNSILENQFSQPFYVWQSPDGVLYCLDGKHRTIVLEEMIQMGFQIPSILPAVFIDCENKKEAARLTIVYSSIYAKITNQGLFDFLSEYELRFDEIKDQIDLPDFSEERFEQKFDLFGVNETEGDNDIPELISNLIVNTGDVFQLGEHRIACGDFRNDALRELLFDGTVARVALTDPPYNLPTNFFSNQKNLKDFAHAHGEMSDDEFSEFLFYIMDAAKKHTVNGSIHYIFMDFRHSWHMCNAAKRAYGSVEPKQVCVWNKDIMANGSFYRAQQELCFIFQNGTAKHLWNNDIVDNGGFYKENDELCFIFKSGDAKHLSHLELKDRIRTNVWRYPSATSTANPDRDILKNHPTPKPVAMIADAILDTTNIGDAVVDFFLGSGTCLISCEKTKRRCFATDIEPMYIQLAITRWIVYCRKNGIQPIIKHLNGSLTVKDFDNAKK